MPTALITGITGQDGAYLARLLLQKGYKVIGGVRRNGHNTLERLDYLGIAEEVETVPLELLEHTNLLDVIERTQPDEVYNLAAQSFVGVSFEQPVFTAEVTGIGALRLLEAIQKINPKIKFYQASSSEMFGKVSSTPQNEETPFHPRSPYAISKAFAHWCAVNYREAYGMFACCGIMFNHESPLRGLEFVTRKISHALARIKVGKQKNLHLGNMEARRDWGYAPEYVEAMWMMLQQDEPDDYVIATGEAHSVRDFVQEAFGVLGLDPQKYVVVDEALRRPADVEILAGDASKAHRKLGWKPTTSFKELVSIMVEEDLKRV
ncbi:MAG: GDP-mannose 4,6-dehydratase [Dehalococcoidia bacterium]|nr:GDP-mannose 4,6-dehydratase [Dehalococcoidia bacterium]